MGGRMAATKQTSNQPAVGADVALAGILALLIDEREERTQGQKDAVKTEVLLARAGLSIEAISAATGKKYDTVRMAISRDQKKG
jgi:hypothetical protein